MPWPIDMIQNTREQNASIVYNHFMIEHNTKMIIKFVLSGFALEGFSVGKKKRVLGFRYLSENAYNVIKEKYPDWIRDGYVILGNDANKLFRLEHVIPTEVTYKHIMNMKKAGTLTLDYVNELADKVCCALVLRTDDDMLNKAGYRSKMPANWNFDMSTFARYENAGVKLHTW